MPEQNDPLLSLISSDAASLNREKIAAFLKPYISFDKTTKDIILGQQFRLLKDNPKKVEILFLASKVKSLIFNEEEGFLPKELITLEIMPEGSVKGTIKKLSDDSKIKKNTNGKYYLPNYRVNEVMDTTNINNK